jgi:hypothetical protein
MKTTRVKSITFMDGVSDDIYNGCVDIFVTLEDNDLECLFEVTTPQSLAFHMDERNQRFLEPL